MNSIVYIFIIFIVLIYLLLTLDERKEKKLQVKKEEKQAESIEENIEPFVYLTSNGYNVCLNTTTDNLFLDNDVSKAEIFKLIKYSRNKIGLQSSTLSSFLMINYTSFHNYEYDVNLHGTNLENNATQLKLLKNKKNKHYYVKFYNEYYLCVDKNGYLFSSKDKSKIFFFKFTVL